MMLRVRPAQFTTTSVLGDGAMSWMRSTSSAPGTLVAVGIETRWYSSNGRLSTTTMSVPPRMSASSSSAEMLGVPAVVLDVLAERLARHVDAGEQLEARLFPGRHAAVENGQIGVAGAGQHVGGALRQAVAVVDQHDARGVAWHQARKAQLQAAERHIARPQQMALREGQLLAHVDQRQLLAVGEHGAERLGGHGSCR